jgi:hypothetical protein
VLPALRADELLLRSLAQRAADAYDAWKLCLTHAGAGEALEALWRRHEQARMAEESCWAAWVETNL